MSERLTPEWTETLEEAFGASGAKGKLGELYMMEVFKKWGWEATHHESDKKMQRKGIDVTFKKPSWFNSYTGDVKNNMRPDGLFYVHREWLDKIQCDRVFHVNPEQGMVAWYGVEDMRQYYKTKQKWIEIDIKNQPAFVKRAKVNV